MKRYFLWLFLFSINAHIANTQEEDFEKDKNSIDVRMNAETAETLRLKAPFTTTENLGLSEQGKEDIKNLKGSPESTEQKQQCAERVNQVIGNESSAAPEQSGNSNNSGVEVTVLPESESPSSDHQSTSSSSGDSEGTSAKSLSSGRVSKKFPNSKHQEGFSDSERKQYDSAPRKERPEVWKKIKAERLRLKINNAENNNTSVSPANQSSDSSNIQDSVGNIDSDSKNQPPIVLPENNKNTSETAKGSYKTPEKKSEFSQAPLTEFEISQLTLRNKKELEKKQKSDVLRESLPQFCADMRKKLASKEKTRSKAQAKKNLGKSDSDLNNSKVLNPGHLLSEEERKILDNMDIDPLRTPKKNPVGLEEENNPSISTRRKSLSSDSPSKESSPSYFTKNTPNSKKNRDLFLGNDLEISKQFSSAVIEGKEYEDLDEDLKKRYNNVWRKSLVAQDIRMEMCRRKVEKEAAKEKEPKNRDSGKPAANRALFKEEDTLNNINPSKNSSNANPGSSSLEVNDTQNTNADSESNISSQDNASTSTSQSVLNPATDSNVQAKEEIEIVEEDDNNSSDEDYIPDEDYRSANSSGNEDLDQPQPGSSSLDQTQSAPSSLDQTQSGSSSLDQTQSAPSSLDQTQSGSSSLDQTQSGSSSLDQPDSASDSADEEDSEEEPEPTPTPILHTSQKSNPSGSKFPAISPKLQESTFTVPKLIGASLGAASTVFAGKKFADPYVADFVDRYILPTLKNKNIVTTAKKLALVRTVITKVIAPIFYGLVGGTAGWFLGKKIETTY